MGMERADACPTYMGKEVFIGSSEQPWWALIEVFIVSDNVEIVSEAELEDWRMIRK